MKNRFDLLAGYFGLFLILVFLTSSCATESWDFIGTWNLQPDKLTYINSDQRIKLTFPNDKWGVYTKPTKPNEHLKRLWKNPWAEDSSYVVLLAYYPDWPGHDVSMCFYIAPLLGHNPWIEENTGLEQYLALITMKMGPKVKKIFDYKVIQRKGRKIGVVRGKGPKGGIIAIWFSFKEKGRFSSILFMFDENLFESNKNQFWAIVDSYEYIE
jgi:hypothetical protein